MKRIVFDRSDAVWFAGPSAVLIGFFAFFGKEIAVGGVVSVWCFCF